MQALPEAPPKKSRGKTVLLTIAVTVGILWVIGTLIEQNEPAPVSTVTHVDPESSFDSDPNPGLQGDDLQILRSVWYSVMTASERTAICDYYLTPPVGTTPEMVQAFADGANMSYAEAEPLLDQLLFEEC